MRTRLSNEEKIRDEKGDKQPGQRPGSIPPVIGVVLAQHACAISSGQSQKRAPSEAERRVREEMSARTKKLIFGFEFGVV